MVNITDPLIQQIQAAQQPTAVDEFNQQLAGRPQAGRGFFDVGGVAQEMVDAQDMANNVDPEQGGQGVPFGGGADVFGGFAVVGQAAGAAAGAGAGAGAGNPPAGGGAFVLINGQWVPAQPNQPGGPQPGNWVFENGQWIWRGGLGPGPGGGVMVGGMVTPMDIPWAGEQHGIGGPTPAGQNQILNDLIQGAGLGTDFGVLDYYNQLAWQAEQKNKDRNLKLRLMEMLMGGIGGLNTGGGELPELGNLSFYNTQGGAAGSTAPGGPMAHGIAGDVADVRPVKHLGQQIQEEVGGPEWQPRNLAEGFQANAADMPLGDAFRAVDARRRVAEAPERAQVERQVLDDIVNARSQANLGTGNWIAGGRGEQGRLAVERARLAQQAQDQQLNFGMDLMQQILGSGAGDYGSILG